LEQEQQQKWKNYVDCFVVVVDVDYLQLDDDYYFDYFVELVENYFEFVENVTVGFAEDEIEMSAFEIDWKYLRSKSKKQLTIILKLGLS
jgi:hypothetical protein